MTQTQVSTPTPTPTPTPISGVSASASASSPQPTMTSTDLVSLADASSSSSSSSSVIVPSTISKEQIKDHLRQWIRVENEISTLSLEIKKRKLIHQQLSASLLDVMRKNDIDCFDIANGKIVYSKVKRRAPLNNGQIRSALTTYYKDDADKANNLTEFLLSTRVEKTHESIKMKIPKI